MALVITDSALYTVAGPATYFVWLSGEKVVLSSIPGIILDAEPSGRLSLLLPLLQDCSQNLVTYDRVRRGSDRHTVIWRQLS